jgi:ribosome biogenesis GTPase
LKHLSKRKLAGLRKAFKEKDRWHEARAALEQEERPQSSSAHRFPVVRRMAPNLDRLVIVSSFGIPPYKPRLVDRLLILASLEDLPAIVVLNKVDLAEQRAQAEAAARLYRSIGVDCLVTSTLTGEGVSLLRERLEGHSSGLVGHSGVGKSSLLRAIEPALEGVQIGDVSQSLGRGKHTTTEVRFYPMSGPREGRIYDLPGLKLVPVEEIEPVELSGHFPELAGVARGCRFGDCLHRDEPACAVKGAVDEGLIASSRYLSYLDLLEGLGR